MRTVIIVGFLTLGDAIRNSTAQVYDEDTMRLLGLIIVASMLMDVVDFFRERK